MFRHRAVTYSRIFGLRRWLAPTACCVLATGCGGARGAAQTDGAAPPIPSGSAIHAPKPRPLRPGQTLEITKKLLETTGFQVSCLSGGQRANVEVVPGQRVPVGTVVRYPGGGPVVVIDKRGVGRYRLSCRTS
jgi:hypothetical protein